MAWYARKSFRMGPVRFNLSKGGVGASVGVKGLRVGVDARGRSYLHAGAGGIYYRQSLSTGSRSSGATATPLPTGSSSYTPTPTTPASTAPVPTVRPPRPVSPPVNTHGPMVEQGGAHEELQEDEVTRTIEEAAKYESFISLAVAAAVSLCLIAVAIVVMPASAGLLHMLGAAALVAGGITLIVIAWMRDRDNRFTLRFELDAEAAQRWQSFCHALGRLNSTTTKLRTANADVYDAKYHAGASKLVSVRSIRIASNRPIPCLASDVPLPAFEFKQGTRYRCLPDRIIVQSGTRIGVLNYQDIEAQRDTTRIIEDHAPRDGQVVDHTWRYINKDGGPDRRFNDNVQLPIVEYAVIRLRTAGGMDHELIVSDGTKADAFLSALKAMADMGDSYVRPIALPNVPALESVPQAEVPEIDTETSEALPENNQAIDPRTQMFAAILDSLCCMMFADGTASLVEREKIHLLMEKINAPWSPAEVEHRMRAFRLRIAQSDFESVLEDASAQLSQLRTSNRQRAAFSRCLDAVASADGTVDDAETRIRNRLRFAIESSVS